MLAVILIAIAFVIAISRRGGRLIGAVLLPILAVALAACGSGTTTTPPSSSNQTTAAPSSPAAPAEPDTAAGAQAAAQTVFELYGGGQYSAVYTDMAPSFTSQVPEPTYVAVHQDCPSSGLSYQVTDPVLTGNTAVVTVSLAGAASALASETMAFDYVSGKWLWAPSAQMTAPYKAGSVAQIVTALKAEGPCH
jgi:hypothetical protein